MLQALGLLVAGVGVLLLHGVGPRAGALGFGALSGIGSTVGSLSLYHGMTKGRMATVATLSAVLTAVLPASFGLVLGQRLSLLAALGIVVSLPAIALICWQPRARDTTERSSGAAFGMLSGAGFALLFIALDRAGTHSGAWPLLPGQAMALLTVLPFARFRNLDRSLITAPRMILIVLTGVISTGANLLFLAASGHGDLAIVAVLSAMYPAITILMARLILQERMNRRQALGLLIAAAAIILVSVG